MVLDPTAGGGSIPFDWFVLICQTIANDLICSCSIIPEGNGRIPIAVGGKLIGEFKTDHQVLSKVRGVADTIFSKENKTTTSFLQISFGREQFVVLIVKD